MCKMFFLFLLVTFLSSPARAETEDIESFARVKMITVHVKSRNVELTGYSDDEDEISKKYPAGTPTVKSSPDVPFGLVGEAYKIVLNPKYIPTKKHLHQEKINGVKNPKELYPPGDKDNPLGKMKMYFTFPGIDPAMSFGLHTTNKPDSVGHRVSEGCARMLESDAREILSIILKQNDRDADSLFQEMLENPNQQIKIVLKNKPKVRYLND